MLLCPHHNPLEFPKVASPLSLHHKDFQQEHETFGHKVQQFFERLFYLLFFFLQVLWVQIHHDLSIPHLFFEQTYRLRQYLKLP